MIVKIEKGIPIPPPVKTKKESQYPFKEMEIGDSILAKGQETNGSCKAYGAAKSYGKKVGWKFIGRKVGVGKIRIWRIA
jgi:hypothetical protein